MRRIPWATVLQVVGSIAVLFGVGWAFGYAIGLIVVGLAALGLGIGMEMR